jgi:hypothetical protein
MRKQPTEPGSCRSADHRRPPGSAATSTCAEHGALIVPSLISARSFSASAVSFLTGNPRPRGLRSHAARYRGICDSAARSQEGPCRCGGRKRVTHNKLNELITLQTRGQRRDRTAALPLFSRIYRSRPFQDRPPDLAR